MTLTFRLDKPADFIFDHLTDMQKFASVHPVIRKNVSEFEETLAKFKK